MALTLASRTPRASGFVALALVCASCATVRPPPPPGGAAVDAQTVAAHEPAPPSIEAELSFAVHTPGGILNLAEVRPTAMENHAAVYADGFSRIFTDERLVNMGWAGAAVAPTGEVFAVLDSAVESPGWEVAVIRSRDGGQSWELLSTLRKPYYLATVDAVTADSADVVCLKLILEDDVGSGVATGPYATCSRDGGRTFPALATSCAQ